MRHMLRLPQRLFSATVLRHRKPQNVRFGESLEVVDLSIQTMEKILTILNDAEKPHLPDPEAAAPEAPQLLSEEFESRFYDKLGSDVFRYKSIQTLTQRALIQTNAVFREVSPDATAGILNRYVSVLKERYLWLAKGVSMDQLGRSFAENTQDSLRGLTRSISSLCSELILPAPAKEPWFDIGPWDLHNPFRDDPKDPLALRKGLKLRRFPESLAAVMINDQNLLSALLKNLNSDMSVTVLRNFMAAQALEGSLAFKMLVKKHLRGVDPLRTIHSPFEAYRFPIYEAENDSDIDVVKAIVASRSKLWHRLCNMRNYRAALLVLGTKNYTSKEIVKLGATLFDQYFGVCYRSDPKYCDVWVGNLVTFYLEHESDLKMFGALFQNSMREFDELVSSAQSEQLNLLWKDENSQRVSKPRKAPRKKAAVSDFFSVTRDLVSRTTQSHETAASPQDPTLLLQKSSSS